MTEEAQPKKKAWRYIEDVAASALENKLNELSEDGYQVYRLDRREEDGGWKAGQHLIDVRFDIIAMDPSIIGNNATKGMLAALSALSGQNFPQPGQPIPATVP